MGLVSTFTRNLFRGSRLLDVPAILAQVKFQELRRRYYDEYWPKVAQETGAVCEKWDGGFHRLTRGGTAILVRGPEVRLDDHLTLDLMGNKALTYRLMAEQGFAVPEHVRFRVTGMSKALALLKSSGRPLVIKPASGTGGGRGVTTGITAAAALRFAALSAARFDADLIAEEQIEGHSYRLLFLDGQFIDAIRRDPPRVTGDGRHSIADLVAAENRQRLLLRPVTALSPLRLDRDAWLYLAAQDLLPRSVPAKGETIIVKRAVNENTLTENVVVRNSVHAETIVNCARLVRALGVRFAGIDILARDIARPLTRDNGLIGEVNTTPGLHHHDLVANRQPGPSVAAVLVEHLFTLAGQSAWRETQSLAHLRMAAA